MTLVLEFFHRLHPAAFPADILGRLACLRSAASRRRWREQVYAGNGLHRMFTFRTDPFSSGYFRFALHALVDSIHDYLTSNDLVMLKPYR